MADELNAFPLWNFFPEMWLMCWSEGGNRLFLSKLRIYPLNSALQKSEPGSLKTEELSTEEYDQISLV